MDIYEARELQKELFQSSNCDFKKMGMVFNKDHTKIAYFVTHHIVPEDSMYVTGETIKRMTESFESGVIIKIDYISEERKKRDKLVSPVGLYIVELIEID